MSIKLIADSSCDLPVETAHALGIDLVPVHVLFCEDGKTVEYTHHKDITTEQFYQMLLTCEELPRTSQPSPHEFQTAYESNCAFDDIICLTVTSKMSGVYNSACLAARLMLEDYQNGGGCERLPRVHVVDTRNCSGGATVLALEAVRMIREGLSPEKIVAELERLRTYVGTYFVLDTLSYARKAGRTGGIRPILGELLGIKPVLTFVDGVVEDTDLIRSTRGVNRWLVEKFSSSARSHDRVVLYHSAAPGRAEALKALLTERFPALDVLVLEVGAVIGVYTGHNCLGLSFLTKEV